MSTATDKEKQKTRMKMFALLQAGVAIYAAGTVCSKMASAQPVLSLPFVAWLGAQVFMLFLYALIWQQAIKTIELSVAYANKAIGIFWSLLWGVLLFHERVNFGKVAAILLVACGTVLMNLSADENASPGESKRGEVPS